LSEKNDDSSSGNSNDSLSIRNQKNDKQYDARKRDPQYSNADKSRLWELIAFTKHFHPTVALYATQIINGQSISGQPELHLHTTTHFLDKFVFRNPKKHDKIKGSDPLLQPMVTSEPGRVVIKKGTGISKDELNVNSKEFWTMKLEDVPVDQIFFHKYFTQKHAGKDLQKVRKEEPSPENDFPFVELGEGSDEENEIWEAMKSELPVDLDSDFEDEDDLANLENYEFTSDDDDAMEMNVQDISY